MPLRILDASEVTRPIASPIRNVDFSRVIISVVAVCRGEPV